jgi:peptide/nickel transport system substrate-binding protein
VANPSYWGGKPRIDRLVFRQIPEAATRVASLLAGETHIIEEVPVDLIPRIKSARLAELASVATSGSLVLTFDTRKPPFNDPRVRLAVDLAIDRGLINDEILAGTGEILQGQLLTKETFGFNPNLKARPYDPARAKQLLAEAGYPNGFATSITNRSGRYVSDVEIGNAIGGFLDKIGVRTQVNVVEGGVYSRMATAMDMGPMHMVGWYSLGDADFNTVWFTDASKRAFWKNDEYERLFNEARSTVDEKKRLQAYHRMMEIMHAENPAVFLYGVPSVYGKSKALAGWVPPSDRLLRLSKSDLK